METLEEFSAQSILSNISCFRVYDYVEQLACIKQLPEFLKAHPQVHIICILHCVHLSAGVRSCTMRCCYHPVTGSLGSAGQRRFPFQTRFRRHGSEIAPLDFDGARAE